MYIETNKDWEIDLPGYNKLSPPGTRIYPFVDVSGTSLLFHVDVLVHSTDDDDDDDCMFWKRFITTDIIQAFILIDDDHVNEFKISLQRSEKHEYIISMITEVLQAEDSAGQISYVFVCKDGKRVLYSSLAESEQELKNKKSIYRHGEKAD